MERLTLYLDQKAYHIKKQTKRKQSHLQDLEDIIKEENETLKTEYIELNKVKDTTAKIWKFRTSVLGPKHKAQEPTCISHPVTGELVANPEDIKKVSLEHNLKILTKNTAQPQDKELDEQKLATHNMIMEADNKDQDKLEFSTYETVLKRLTLKDKKMYKHITKAGEQFQIAMFKYYEPLINLELVPETYNYTKLFGLWKGKGSKLDLSMERTGMQNARGISG